MSEPPVPILSLPIATSISGAEWVPIVQGTTTSRTLASTFLTGLTGGANTWSGNQTMPKLILSGGVQLSATQTGILLLQNQAGTGFSALKFGSSAATSPAFFFSGTAILAKLADNSAETNMFAASFRASVFMQVADGVTAPSASPGFGRMYVDQADGSLKFKFGNGTVKTLATNP